MSGLEFKVPPPVVGLASGALMWLLAQLGGTVPVPQPLRLGIAVVFAGAGVLLAGRGARTLNRTGTTMNPMKADQATALVTTGIYRYTRNPMYLGVLVILLGWAVYLSSAPALLGLPAFVLYMNRFQIQPEERALAARFGRSYEEFRARVRRWL